MLHLRCKINKGDTKIDFLFLFVFFLHTERLSKGFTGEWLRKD